ncbi:DUF4194 domain-containing protein [Xanthomonas cerealis pv. cerealis]|uniref:DUF4194 domain-containing protein n=1 Tax=Xanthomonas cerealis pv. cerealis TaxID=152263 RepID=A0A514EBN4_9XANT|nr:DUF4194 domain-containing protein [Xanthomonas translucens]QDI03430.1 DUF4194 domain-containing protein [Xanthomonas translucens pv. cerealis]
MSTMWDRLAEKSKIYEANDFERAAYHLVTAQVLSVSDMATRKDYHIVAENLPSYEGAMALLGVNIKHVQQFRYIVATPRHVFNHAKATKAMTLLALVLRSVYHTIRLNGQEGDFGEGYIELPDLQDIYKNLTKMEFPKTAELRAQVVELERWGIAKQTESAGGDNQPFRIMIHPAISEIITEEWLGQLDLLRKHDDIEAEDREADDVSA